MSTDHRCVVVGVDSADLRRRLGPTAWVVFEELLLASTGPEDGPVATVSVRSLAASLGLAKDTVASALGRLRRAGLVTATQTRTGAGLFTTGSYRLTVPDAITVTVTHTTRRTTGSRRRRRSVSQLALSIDS
jgi:predicted transcriptional regulator